MKNHLNYTLLILLLIIATHLSAQTLPTGCPTSNVENGNISIAEPLPTNGISWLSSSPFWSCTQNGNNFDVTPYLAPPNPNAFTLVGLPAANYCSNFEGIPLDTNGNQLPTIFNQCCFTVGNSDAACPASPVEVNTNFTITTNLNPSYQNCSWTQNGQALNGITGNSLSTQVSAAGNYNYVVTCCSTGGGNGNNILPLQTRITTADNTGAPNINIPPKCVWVDHPGKPGVEIMRINDDGSSGDVHQYSRRSAFTIDGKYFAMSDGRLINIEDCSVKCDLGTSTEFVLSQVDPNIAFGWSGRNFYKVNNNNVNNKELLYTAPSGYERYTIGRWEGQQDFNDKYILLQFSSKTEGDGGDAIILNLQTGATGSTIDLNNLPGIFNWGDVSANGTYALVGTSVGVYRFNIPNFTNQTELEISNRTGSYHYDMMYDALGNEVMVMAGEGGNGNDWAYNILSTNQYVTLDVLEGSSVTAQCHVSGQAKNRPGWMYVSGSVKSETNRYLFSVELKPGNSQVESWGSTYSAVNPSYIAQPKASVSANGDLVVTSTNWNVNGGPVYEVIYRPKNLVTQQQQCETFSCTVTAIADENHTKITGCPTEDLTAPASWNVRGIINNGEIFVSWTWTLNGQSVNLIDETNPGFGVVNAEAGIYVGTMNYLNVNGLPQSETCEIKVVGSSNPPIGCPTEIVEDGNISIQEPLPTNGTSWLSNSPFWSCKQNGNNFDVTPYLAPPNPNAFTLAGLPAGEYCCNFEGIPLDANGNPLSTVYNQCCFTVGTSNEPDDDDCQTNGTAFANVSNQSAVAWNEGNPYVNRTKPALHVWEPGDIPGTEIMRVSDDSGNGLHYYNSRQVWNIDMTKMMIGDGVVADNKLLDATNNYALLPNRIPFNTNRVWSNTNPNLIYGMQGQSNFCVFNVTTRVNTVLYTRPGGSSIGIRGKGNLPGDDSKIALYEQSTNRIISFNIQTNSIIAEIVWPNGTLTGGAYVSYDWSGNWIVVGMASGELYRMKPNLTEITQVFNEVRHFDFAYNTAGESVLVHTGYDGSVRVVNFDDPNKTYYSPIFGGADPNSPSWSATPDYISGRGQTGAPGWVAFGGESGVGSGNHPLGLYKIDGNTNAATIKVIGFDHHSDAAAISESGNDDRQKPSVSPDGNQVIFTSDWGVPNGPLSSYIIRGTVCDDDITNETLKFEAENGTPSGVNTATEASASAGKYVTGFDNDADKITVLATVENAGMYQLKIGYRSTSGDKKNDVYLNGMFLGNIQFLQSNTFTEMTVGDFYFDAGLNTLEFIKSWGWMDVDYFELVAASNQAGNSNNNFCDRTLEIGYSPTANFYRGGIINSDATISENQEVEYIGTEEINLMNEFTVKKGAKFLTDIEGCED